MSLDLYRQKVTAQWEAEAAQHNSFLLWEGTPGPAVMPFLLTGDAPKGTVIICAGGGYFWKEPQEAFPHAIWLNIIGLNAFVLDYRIKPPHKQPDCALQDAQRAVRTLRHRADEWKIKKDKIAVLGFSSGGHLAAMVSTHFDEGDPQASDPVERESCRPDAQILCYPHITYTPYSKDDPDFMNKFFGEGHTQDDVAKANVHLHVRPDTPRLLFGACKAIGSLSKSSGNTTPRRWMKKKFPIRITFSPREAIARAGKKPPPFGNSGPCSVHYGLKDWAFNCK